MRGRGLNGAAQYRDALRLVTRRDPPAHLPAISAVEAVI